MASARVGGSIVIVSIHKTPQPVDLQTLSFRELRVLGTRVYTRQDFADAIALLPAMADDLGKIVSTTIPPDQVQSAFERLVDGAPDLKIIVITA